MGGPEASILPTRRPLAETSLVRQIAERGLTYLRAGFPVHLSGPAGTGKTTLALHLADAIGRPCIFIQGDDRLTSTGLVWGSVDVRRSKVVDRYIRTVTRTAENISEHRTDGWLATACRHGYTLLYDEFTRSRAEANNVLLSVLEERVLVAAGGDGRRDTIAVHPEFRLILTSNPAEYVGVYRAADALIDRLATIRLDYFDEETEVGIVRLHSGLAEEDCQKIVRLVRHVRSGTEDANARPSLRAAVKLGQILAYAGLPVDFGRADVAGVCLDVFGPAVCTPAGLANMVQAVERAGGGTAAAKPSTAKRSPAPRRDAPAAEG